LTVWRIIPQLAGSNALRSTIANWLAARYGIPAPDADTQVLPVNGSREALFSFAQAVVDRNKDNPTVVCPNPFYQIYEGAAFLSGATPVFLNNYPGERLCVEFFTSCRKTPGNTSSLFTCVPRVILPGA